MKSLRLLSVTLLTIGLAFSLTACEDKPPARTTTDVEVKDRLLGGKEVEKTEVIEQGDKTQIRETETKLDDDGKVEKKEVEVKGDRIE